MPARARVNWNRIREELLGGMSVKALAALHGIAEQTIRNKASMEGWEVMETKAKLLRERWEGKAQEIELAVDQIGSRLKCSSLRTKTKMAEQVEQLLKELEEAEGVGAVMKSRCLASLAQVCEKVHRRSSEPTAAEMEGLKTAAVNLTLIRTRPEQLREMAREKGIKAGKAVEVEGEGVEEAG
jgi:hypothetical protein